MDPSRKYRIHEVLGKGGFGTVYRGELLGAGGFAKAVAVKVLNRDVAANDDVARRLRDEARLLGMLQHRSIVGVDGLVDLGGRWAVIMEYVDGADLGACLNRAPLPPGPALQVIQEVAAGLHAAWSRPGPDGEPLRLLHRDIKPGNIRITPLGEVKILDFGIARADWEGRESETRSVRYGSLNYMSPERLDLVDGEESHKGDVYALGVTLVEALTGEAFGKASLNMTTHGKRVEAAMRRVRRVTEDPGLMALLGDMLSYHEDDRPSAREVERRARQLGRSFMQDLVDWAEGAVPAAQRDAKTFSDELSGTLMVETGGAAAVSGSLEEPDIAGGPDPDRISVSRRTASRAALAGGVLVPILGCGGLLLAGGIIAGVLAFSNPFRSSESPEPSLTEADPDLGLDRPPEREPAFDSDTGFAPDSDPQLDSDPVGEPDLNAKAAIGAAPSPPSEPERTVHEGAKVGEVLITGDAAVVEFVGEAGVFPPGVLPVGVYRVRADFGDGLVQAGRVTVLGSSVHTVSCSVAFATCTEQ